MLKRNHLLAWGLLAILSVPPALTGSVASPRPEMPHASYPNPLVVVSNEGQAGPNVDRTLVRNRITDPHPDWRKRFFTPTGWQDAYPALRAPAWTTSAEIAPLLAAGADHVWGGTPGGPLQGDSGNGTTYPRRHNGADYNNGHPIPASPAPQYLFLRKDFCLPINARANAQRRLTSGSILIHLLNATDSATIPDGAASLWLNEVTIGWVEGDESGSVAVIDIPDPGLLYRGRNTLALRVGDSRSDAAAAVLYRAILGYALDPAAVALNVNTTMPFEQEVVRLDVTTDGLSGRTPFHYAWTLGDGAPGAGVSLTHIYTASGIYTVGLTIADTEFCTATASLLLTVLPYPLRLVKTAWPNPVTAGETLHYRITAQNSSPVRALTNVVVTDTLPAGLTFSSCSGGCALTGRVVRWTWASLGPQSTATFDLYATVALTAAGVLTNAAYGVRSAEVYTHGAPVSVSVLPPPCLKALTGVSISGPTAGITGVTYLFGGSIAPPDASAPLTYTWTPTPTAGGALTATYRWATPGLYTLTLRAANCGGAATATHTIHISAPSPPCPTPLAGVSIGGPLTGVVGTAYTFSAAITPSAASAPLTYTWTPTPTAGGALTATYRWAAPGLYTLTLRAANCGGAATATHTIHISPPSPPCPTPLAGVSIGGPLTGVVGVAYTFSAAITPSAASAPLTYTWTPTPTAGGALTATYRWAAPGPYTLTLRAANCGGAATATHVIRITARPPSFVYLPLTLRNYPDDAPDRCPGWPVAPGTPLAENFDHPGDFDWFTFEATEGIRYTIRSEELDIRADTVITLYDQACTIVYAWSDDLPYPSNSRASEIAWNAAATGPLHVVVRNYEPGFYGPHTGYRLAIYDEAHPAPPIVDAPDFCAAAAAPLVIGQPYTEDFDHANDNDWFVFDVAAGRSYTITTQSLGGRADTALELWDGCAQRLALDDDRSSPASRIVWTAERAGRLAINVRHTDWTIYGAETGYTLTVEE